MMASEKRTGMRQERWRAEEIEDLDGLASLE
jgi:hypothetical protein